MPITKFNQPSNSLPAWGAALSAAIQACGLIKTADTGQINWATVTQPGSVDIVAGYEIYRFNDALQATSPVFMKIEYGSGGQLATTPQYWIRFGTGSDGAGTLTGRVSSRMQFRHWEVLGGAAGTVARDCYVSGSTGRLSFNMWVNYDQRYSSFFSVERTKNSDGSDNGEGLLIQGACHSAPSYIPSNVDRSNSTTWYNYVFILPPGHASVAGRISVLGTHGLLVPGYSWQAQGKGDYGADLALWPTLFNSQRGQENSGINCYWGWSQDITTYSEFDMNVYGQAHHYIMLGAEGFWGPRGRHSSSMEGFRGGTDYSQDGDQNMENRAQASGYGVGLAMRWE